MNSLLNELNFKMPFLFKLFDTIHDGVKIIDNDGNFVFINHNAAINMGIDRNEWIGQPISQLIPNSILLKALETKEPQVNKPSYVSGKQFIVYASPLFIDNEIIGALSTHKGEQDIKEMKEFVSNVNYYVDYLNQSLQNMKSLSENFKDFIVSNGSPLNNQLEKISKVAPTEIPVLINGETGVGKDLIARGIHELSHRADKPFITVNCAAIPDSLAESELFGYEEGSFTGAHHRGRKGKFELAEGGTIFLDEVGEMNLSIQSKLLRVLQQQEVVRLGSNKTIKLDVRVITATNRDLSQMIENKSFREDLFYRIAGTSFYIPPLRERKKDIEALIYHFLKQLAQKYEVQKEISQDCLEFILNHPLPGNVRQLKSMLEHGYILSESKNIQVQDLPALMTTGIQQKHQEPNNEAALNSHTLLENSDSLDLEENKAKLEIFLIKEALQRANNNRSKAIQLLGISRQAFYDRLKKYNKELTNS
ncbi:sigma-54 interaction domain-containing protein [Alteribacillus sp. JSM 102045]|uniref:sigma-54 interaction domain-containing protein n=1 Tax=Alteribacillus sp. JSM 102045 TaxID=1562101 RepID=UPI0035BFEA58